jgi:hypothetical protein
MVCAAVRVGLGGAGSPGLADAPGIDVHPTQIHKEF